MMSVATAHFPSTLPHPLHSHTSGKAAAAQPSPLNLDDVRLFWYDNFQNGEQVAFSSFIAALSLHFNEHFRRPLFSTLAVLSAAGGSQPAFLPLLANSVLFLCIPDLSLHAQQTAIDPTSVDEPYIRRHQFEQFVRTFGSHLPSAIHLAHYSLFAANGALYPWFHGHDHSFDSSSQHGSRGGFLIRFSHSRPGALTVLSCEAGVWEKRHLTCTCQGWQAVGDAERSGKASVLGVYRSLNAYIDAHHRRQQPFPSPFAAMFPATLSASEAGRAWSANESTEQAGELKDKCSHSAILSSGAVDAAAVPAFSKPEPAVPAPYPTIATYSIIPLAANTPFTSSSSSHAPLSPHSSLPSTPQTTPDSPASSTVIDTGSSVHSVDSDVAMSDSDDSQQQQHQQAVQSTVRSGTGCPSIALHEFFYAIAVDDVEAVLSFIRQGQIKLTAADDYGLTCLHIACVHNRPRILHILKRHVPVSLLAAVTLKPLTAASPLLSLYTCGNGWMPYMKTDIELPVGSPCGSMACAYQSSGCLAFIQQWLTELGVQYNNIVHSSHENLAHKP